MQNYSENKTLCQLKNTWLHISFEDDISAELGNVIPYPHHHYMRNNKLVYCWLIDGFFDTFKGVQYLNDIIARFKITFETSQYLKHTVDTESTCPFEIETISRIKKQSHTKIRQVTRFDSSKDFIFILLNFMQKI